MAVSPTQPVLVIDDDQYLLSAIGQTLKLGRYQPVLFSNPLAALEALQNTSYLSVIADIRMPVMDGMELLEKLQAIDPDLPVILITGHGDITLAVQAIKVGAYDFLEKPVDDDILLASLKRAVEKRTLVLENRHLQEQVARQDNQSFYRGMVGCHPLMNRLYDVVEKVAREDDPVLLCGETGTGKELVANAIHEISRPGQPFVAVNMAAMPADIIESELFGHEKGAFTGAISETIGRFEHAGAGTLFLDEICSLPPTLQAKLLRVLEERAFTRVGSNISRQLKARIISATNRNLEEEIEKGTFRQDLFYRLNGLQIDIPPLRNRKEDIPLLVEFFRQEYCRDRERDIPFFSPAQLEEIVSKDWPGNIRELRNTVRRLCVFGEEREAGAGNRDTADLTAGGDRQSSLKVYLESAEKEYILKILADSNGKVGRAHGVLGLSRKGLYDKINKYRIDLELLKGKSRP